MKITEYYLIKNSEVRYSPVSSWKLLSSSEQPSGHSSGPRGGAPGVPAQREPADGHPALCTPAACSFRRDQGGRDGVSLVQSSDWTQLSPELSPPELPLNYSGSNYPFRQLARPIFHLLLLSIRFFHCSLAPSGGLCCA